MSSYAHLSLRHSIAPQPHRPSAEGVLDYEHARRAHEGRDWRAMMAKSWNARAALAALRTHEETNGARGWDELMEKARAARAAAWRAHEGTHEVREWRRRPLERVATG